MDDAALLTALHGILAQAITLARAAPPTHADQKAHQDFVTDVDMVLDRFLQTALTPLVPDAPVLSEERAVTIAGPLAQYWIVDPLDGTMNLLAGLPFTGICVALVDQYGPRVAAVADVNAGAIFSAIRDQGACIDTVTLHIPANPPPLIVLSTGLLDRLISDPKAYAALRAIGKIRNLGAQALHLIGVARGQFAAVASYEARLWDEVAAGLILREAGGHWQAASDTADWTRPQMMMAITSQRSIGSHPSVTAAMQAALADVFAVANPAPVPDTSTDHSAR
jgi:myo-inositol-1(or 4)-monophosphatase